MRPHRLRVQAFGAFAATEEVGFDDLDWSRHLRPSLTTIQVPTAATWQRAGEYLVRHLAGEQTIMHHEVDYSLIVRESTAPPPRSSK